MYQCNKESVEASVILLWKGGSGLDGEGVRVKNMRKEQELYQDYISSKRCIVLTLEKAHEPLKHWTLWTPYNIVHVDSVGPQQR